MNPTPVYPPKITTALHEVMEKCGYVQKRQVNKFHNYKYAGEGDLLDVLRPAMVKAGLLLIPSAAEHSAIDEFGNVNVVVEYTLAHKDGDVWPEKIRAFGTGNDKNNKGGVGDKGTYKAITGANKYMLFKLFQIETGDDPETESDADHSGERVTPQTKAQTNGQAVKPASQEITAEGAEAFVNAFRLKLAKCQEPADVDYVVQKHSSQLSAIKAAFEGRYEEAMRAAASVKTEMQNDPVRLRAAG